jgi:hypothetical protein
MADMERQLMELYDLDLEQREKEVPSRPVLVPISDDGHNGLIGEASATSDHSPRERLMRPLCPQSLFDTGKSWPASIRLWRIRSYGDPGVERSVLVLLGESYVPEDSREVSSLQFLVASGPAADTTYRNVPMLVE